MQKILIIDSNPVLLELLQMFLERKGFTVMSTARVGTAFKLIHGFKPEAIIINDLLGQFYGRDICREIRRCESTKNIYIILMSETGLLPDDYSADDFIEKPVDTSLLIEKLMHATPGLRTV